VTQARAEVPCWRPGHLRLAAGSTGGDRDHVDLVGSAPDQLARLAGDRWSDPRHGRRSIRKRSCQVRRIALIFLLRRWETSSRPAGVPDAPPPPSSVRWVSTPRRALSSPQAITARRHSDYAKSAPSPGAVGSFPRRVRGVARNAGQGPAETATPIDMYRGHTIATAYSAVEQRYDHLGVECSAALWSPAGFAPRPGCAATGVNFGSD
jgi:hypothetical protein